MIAWVLPHIVSMREVDAPLQRVELPTPRPGPGEVLLEVRACGVCHTELDEIEGRAPPASLPMVLGHQVVGTVVERGPGAERWPLGQRLGVGWIHSSCGGPGENLSPEFRATGRDVPGGYAEFLLAQQDYAFPVPGSISDLQAAPLLCAGAIGYRALKRCGLSDGRRLGLMGFGASGHLVLQLARHLFPRSEVLVFARDQASRSLARRLGAHWAGAVEESPPAPADAIIDTTPAWGPVLASLRHLAAGGRLVINAIRKEDGDKARLTELDYSEHLWQEKELKTVANITAQDIAEFLPIAAQIPLRAQVEAYPLEQANQALVALSRGVGSKAKVLVVRAAAQESPS